MTPSWLLDLVAAIMLAVAVASATRVLMIPLAPTGPWRPVQVAADAAEDYADGVWFVGLAALTDVSLVEAAIAQTFGLREGGGRTYRDALGDFLGSRRLLLVLDNCEHLVVACADLVASLLRTCPPVTILVTSREVLGVGGELVWRVPSLSLPPLTQRHQLPSNAPPSAAQVGASEAVQLLLERARAVDS